MKIMQFFGVSCVVFFMLISSVFALEAYESVNITDPCYRNVPTVSIAFSNETMTIVNDFGVQNDCASGTAVRWNDPVDLVLGPVLDDEVVVTSTYVYVDSNARPDLDAPATIIFKKIPFAVEPDVMKDEFPCETCNVTFDATNNNLYVEVDGFSNYSLSGRKDFIVYSDTVPELDKKVYQTVDLGDANRNEEFACVVQVFGQSKESPGQWVLVQTNPQREVQAKLLGNPDSNQPESLGYFKTTGGMANVYFRDENIPGYADFEYVAQCTSNSTKLIYEEPISTTYHPMGRNLVGRGIWLTDGNNAFFIIIGVVLFLIAGLLVLKFIRAVW